MRNEKKLNEIQRNGTETEKNSVSEKKNYKKC
jgi:hypothetical protein